MKIHDISKLIDENILVYPGDPSVKINKIKNIASDGWNISEFCMSTHTCTHIDTLLHIEDKSPGAENVPLEKCYGECQVLDLMEIPFGESITEKYLKKFVIEKNEIILIKTKNSILNNNEFKNDFVFLSKNGAEYLVKKGIKSVGIDYLSIGPKEVHKILLENEVLIFENLSLKKIRPKNYTFIGLPLKIKAEGAPARVILIEE